ncbi:MAG TPA: Ig-like domain-containing protein [Gemmatimonadales bacterium]|nr:Ig-like domain-containing protein [Gemmatimonadales bacterium]
MPPTLTRLLLQSLLLMAAQGSERLRKTDLVRLLSNATLASDELAALIRRTCLSFSPTGRDRADFVALGADAGVLREIDGCARRAAARRAASSAGAPRPAATAPRVAEPAVAAAGRSPAPPVPLASPARTGFVLGVGQHVPAGTPPALPLWFEVRDTAGAPVAGAEVALSVVNGRLGAARIATDSSGRVRVDLTVGPRIGAVSVTATVGTLERQATLYAEPGPAVRLALRCGSTEIAGRVSLTPRVPIVLRVSAQDAFGNVAPISGLQAAAGDRRVLRVALVSGDSAEGLVRVEPRDEGSTSLVVVASRQREDVSVTVAKGPASAGTRCW